MVSLTLKVILHVAENDSKYCEVAPLKMHYNATQTVHMGTGERRDMKADLPSVGSTKFINPHLA